MCNEKNLILHDFSEVVQYMPIMKLDLAKSSLSGEYADLQKNDKI